MKKNISFALTLLFIAICSSTIGQTVTYQASNDIIANPERGLQKYSITSNAYATAIGTNNLPVTTLNAWKTSSDKVTVVFRYFLLDAFLNSNINSTYLNNIQTDFDNARLAGVKLIVRFSYSNAQGTTAQQPIKSQILTHISQLATVLNTNKDVIFSHQAGFIGTWGEWYYTNSAEFGTDGSITAAQWLNRKEIVVAMLAATPVEVPIQVRYAEIKTNMYGSTPLNPLSAYQNTPNARIGFFNDAFLNDYGDQGTYSVSSQCTNPVGTTDYNYIANETQYIPMTGETNGLNGCNSGFRTTGANAVNEMNLTNWTTINRDYFTAFWNGLIATNHYDTILKSLGYRLVLDSSTLTVNGSTFDLDLNLRNIGFARPFMERDVYLVLKNTATNVITTMPFNTDVRTWESSVSISQNFNLGLGGIYDLYLWLPDNSPTIENNPEYSIQLANLNTWDATTGYNDLQQTLTIIPVALAPELLDFNILLNKNEQVELAWVTSSEINNDYFTIEQSTNGFDWKAIQQIDGKGFSSSPTHYSAIDFEPVNGINYYRLRQTSFDKEFIYSNTRSIYKTENQAIQIFPNPTSNIITLTGNLTELENFGIYNTLGQNVSSFTQQIVIKEKMIQIDLSNLTRGLYYIRTNNTSKKVYKK